MEEFKAKSHAVKKMTRKGLVETDSREGIVKETAEAKSDMAYQSSTMIGDQRLIRIDYEKYILN